MPKFRLRVNTIEAVRLRQKVVIHEEAEEDEDACYDVGSPGDWLVIEHGMLKTFSDDMFRQRFAPADAEAEAVVKLTSGMPSCGSGYKD